MPEKPKTPKGYVDANLIAGEKVTYRGGLHWIVLVAPISIAVVIVLFGVAMLVAGGSAKETDLRELAYSAGALAILVAAIYLLVAILEWRAAEFAVTNKRVIFKVGVLKRRTQEMFLEKDRKRERGRGTNGPGARLRNHRHSLGQRAERSNLSAISPTTLEFRRQVQEQISQNSPQFARRSDPS